MIIKQVPSGQILEQTFNRQTIDELVAAEDYEQAADFLYAAQMVADQQENTLISNLLAVARRMCLASALSHAEMQWHHWAAQEAGDRRTDINQRLREIIEAIEDLTHLQAESKTKVVTSIRARPAKPFIPKNSEPVRNNVFWKSMAHLLKRESDPVKQALVYSEAIRPALDDITPTGHIDDAENQLVIYSLGTFQVYRNGDLIENWPSRKGLLIFKYLVTHRDHQIHKESLMDLFWPDSEEEAQRNNLNVAIYGMRQALRNGNPSFSHVLFQNDCYFVNHDLNIWADYEAFDEHFKNGQRLEHQNQQKAAIREYETAESLYQGIFLPEDCYEEWTESQRQQLQTAYLSLLDRLSGYYLGSDNYPACIMTCQKLLTVDTCLEEAHTQLMRCYSRQGQPYLALRQYDRCVTALAEELDTLPMPETIALRESIRAGERI